MTTCLSNLISVVFRPGGRRVVRFNTSSNLAGPSGVVLLEKSVTASHLLARAPGVNALSGLRKIPADRSQRNLETPRWLTWNRLPVCSLAEGCNSFAARAAVGATLACRFAVAKLPVTNRGATMPSAVNCTMKRRLAHFESLSNWL